MVAGIQLQIAKEITTERLQQTFPSTGRMSTNLWEELEKWSLQIEILPNPRSKVESTSFLFELEAHTTIRRANRLFASGGGKAWLV